MTTTITPNATELNITWFAGDDLTITGTCTDAGGSTFALAGCSITYALHKGKTAGGAVAATITSASGTITINSNQFVVPVASSVSDLLEGDYYQVCVVTDTSNIEYTAFYGRLVYLARGA